jgi:hypothetical protein
MTTQKQVDRSVNLLDAETVETYIERMVREYFTPLAASVGREMAHRDPVRRDAAIAVLEANLRAHWRREFEVWGPR